MTRAAAAAAGNGMKRRTVRPGTPPPAARPTRRETILVVDDDPLFRREFMECFGEYRFIEASRAEEALAILRRPHEIDLVVLDVRMRGMDGIQALAGVRDAAPGAGVIIVTGHGTKETVIRALRAAADDYIEKPFDIEATRRIIQRHLERRRDGIDVADDDLRGRIARVQRFVMRNCLRRVGLADAGRLVGLSPKYLSRVFREQVGVRFSDYRTRLRMERAKELLAESGCTIQQISDRLGYENAESFTRRFRKLTG
ncbi:MAG: response regulator [bacterium]|nr:response regulator [bacterium]